MPADDRKQLRKFEQALRSGRWAEAAGMLRSGLPELTRFSPYNGAQTRPEIWVWEAIAKGCKKVSDGGRAKSFSHLDEILDILVTEPSMPCPPENETIGSVTAALSAVSAMVEIGYVVGECDRFKKIERLGVDIFHPDTEHFIVDEAYKDAYYLNQVVRDARRKKAATSVVASISGASPSARRKPRL